MQQRKTIIILLYLTIISIFFINFISSLDSELFIACGGDNELTIMCVQGDNENSPFGEPQSVQGGVSSSLQKEKIISQQEITKFKEDTLTLLKQYWILFLILFFLMLLFLLIFFRKIIRK